MEQNQDEINWDQLSRNPNAIHLLEQNRDEINWRNLSRNPNPNAFHLLETLIPIFEQYDSEILPYLGIPNAYHLIENFLYNLTITNPMHNVLFDYDYVQMKEKKQAFNQALIERVFHPERLIRFVNHLGMDLQDYFTELDY